MIRILYEAALFGLGLITLPKLVWQRITQGKYKGNAFLRLGCILPPKLEGPIIWFHAVSLGETKAVSLFIRKLKAEYPNHRFILSSVTETGHNEAKKNADIDLAFYLPLDFRFIMKRLVSRFRPEMLFLVETDFWLNHISEVKKHGGKIFLLNGKISENSIRRFTKWPTYKKALFDPIEHFYVQSEMYQKRYLSLGIPSEKISITGNLKFDSTPKILSEKDRSQLLHHLGASISNDIITIGSTHPGEEDLLLETLTPLLKNRPNLKILLVPRHPERFDNVAISMHRKGYVFQRYSQIDPITTSLVLIDKMGLLLSLYQISKLAIVAGSFVPGIGGHNIFEPLFLDVPCLFGPYMHGQLSLVSHVLSANAGMQLSPEEISSTLEDLLQDKSKYKMLKQSADSLTQKCRGATDRTLESCMQRLL